MRFLGYVSVDRGIVVLVRLEKGGLGRAFLILRQRTLVGSCFLSFEGIRSPSFRQGVRR
jgi:hypothetical protein